MRPPFFAFYPADFANDLLVEAMSTLQVGAYMLLLCKAWQGEPPASLPSSDQVLARFARVDAVVWAEIKAGVLAPFHVGADGRLHSKRLRREYDAALKRMRTAQAAGSEGGKATQRAVKTARTANSQATLEGSLEAPLKGRLSGGQALEIGDKRLEKKEKTPQPPAEPGGGGGLNDPRTVPLPPALDTPAFRDAWTKFIAYRASKGKKNALTALAAQLALKKATSLGPALAIERIERAIMNGWLALEYASDGNAGGGHGAATGDGTGSGRGVRRVGRAEPGAGEYDLFGTAGPGPTDAPAGPPGPPAAGAA